MEQQERMVAVKLAARLFVLDYGRYPTALADLLPRYLPSIPEDPYAPDGKPLGYLLAADGKRPIVYSVGPDGIDQTAADAANIPTEYQVGWRGAKPGMPDDEYLDLSTWVSGKPRVWKDPTATPVPGLSGLGLEGSDEDAADTDAPGDKPEGENDGQ
jgi:hypothetical protein